MPVIMMVQRANNFPYVKKSCTLVDHLTSQQFTNVSRPIYSCTGKKINGNENLLFMSSYAKKNCYVE